MMHGYQVFVTGFGNQRHLFNVGGAHDLRPAALRKRAARKGCPLIKYEVSLAIFKGGRFVKMIHA
jgi:hypothetical protein